MSILIEGIDMPKEGDWITLRVFPDGQCFLYNWCGNDFDFMKPLTVVPVPLHGRLIDANVLYEDCVLDHNYQVMATTTRINEYMQLKIDNASTIIEAEEVYDKYTDTAGNFHWCGTKSDEHTIKT